MYGTPIKLGLLKTTNENAPCLRIKVNHVRENFIPNLEQLSLVLYKQNRYSCIRLALVVELIRKTNADRFRHFDDILSLSRK